MFDKDLDKSLFSIQPRRDNGAHPIHYHVWQHDVHMLLSCGVCEVVSRVVVDIVI